MAQPPATPPPGPAATPAPTPGSTGGAGRRRRGTPGSARGGGGGGGGGESTGRASRSGGNRRRSGAGYGGAGGTPGGRVTYEEHLTRDAINAGLKACAPRLLRAYSSFRVLHADTRTVFALLQSGALFAGAVRVNGRRRHQGYVSLEGLPADVLLDGLSQQNRAVRFSSLLLLRTNPTRFMRLLAPRCALSVFLRCAAPRRAATAP
jgi:hypothetical protein